MLSRRCHSSFLKIRLPNCRFLANLQRPWLAQSVPLGPDPARPFSSSSHLSESITEVPGLSDNALNTYRASYTHGMVDHHVTEALFESPQEFIGKRVKICGYIGKRKDIRSDLSFVPISRIANGPALQIVSKHENIGDTAHRALRFIKPNSAVVVRGTIRTKHVPRSKNSVEKEAYKPTDGNVDTSNNSCDTVSLDTGAEPCPPQPNSPADGIPKAQEVPINLKDIELVLDYSRPLGIFPDDIIVSDNAEFGPEARHLQIRFDKELQQRLLFRHKVLKATRQALSEFQEIETPILFKSTPEGAREFLVPTRRPGFAYALPQSPQQYKQILMASGIHRYFQIAKCFRDEDLRADRQPEFTQIDLEMAFADGESVMARMEKFIVDIYTSLQGEGLTQTRLPRAPFPRMTYNRAMNRHGVDKPDLRIKNFIHRVEPILPQDLVRMMTSLNDPIVEAYKITLAADPSVVRKFVSAFMDSAEGATFQANPDGPPGVFVYDPRKPLEGLQAFGFEGLASLKNHFRNISGEHYNGNIYPELSFEDSLVEGDLIILQARPNVAHSGGSTSLGRFRTAIHKAAVAAGLKKFDPSHKFLWVTDFPLFTLNNETDPGQGGAAGFSATHHPFTAPKKIEDVDLMFTDPLKAKADHYDLVVNGVELGGGSRRIHNSEVQQFVMRNVLKVSEERLRDFSHLFEALRAGCPPHAGIAFGLDRLVAIMSGKESVRDVIAFPKSGKGEDLMVKSPTLMTMEQLATYHLEVKN